MPLPDFQSAAKAHYEAMPHPLNPDLTVGEFPLAVKLATATKFGGVANAQEAGMFYKEFRLMGMEPGHYLDTLKRVAPLSFRFQNRPPTMEEIKMLGSQPLRPDVAHNYYSNLPDLDYPDVPAGHMVKAMAAAHPYAIKHLDRPATKNEARFIHHAGLNASGIDQHYQYLAQDAQMVQPQGAQPQHGA